ncbi:MAG TPA: alkaline phosphatase family protein [Candidatus Binatia bacterium]|nr:alkaline phosphatase family protein [Candidatus Binatia bacterium]
MAGQIKHIVIIVKENHTFDNYFGTFPGADGAILDPAANPPPDDPDHRHQAWMARTDDLTHRVQYSEADIPAYFAYARDFTLCDNYFAEVAGPSTPNHLMLICADAPIINNPAHHYRPRPGDSYTLRSLPSALEHAHLTWGNYGGYAFHYIAELAGHHGNHSRDLFVQHAARGRLPAVSWVYGDGRPDLSEHPRQNVTDGSQWTAEQIDAIVAGGLWEQTAIFITWDDWGGWFDHVLPPVKETWESARAQHPADAHPEFNGDPFRFGSRVPCLVLSPYAKPGYISHQENSHVSLVKFCETIFGLAPLNDRDGAANGMSDCFDFTQQPLPAPQRRG